MDFVFHRKLWYAPPRSERTMMCVWKREHALRHRRRVEPVLAALVQRSAARAANDACPAAGSVCLVSRRNCGRYLSEKVSAPGANTTLRPQTSLVLAWDRRQSNAGTRHRLSAPEIGDFNTQVALLIITVSYWCLPLRVRA